jgi:hypothetical protein
MGDGSSIFEKAVFEKKTTFWSLKMEDAWGTCIVQVDRVQKA